MRVLAFDIESADADQVHSYGPGFIRLCGWKWVGSNDPVTISTDPAELVTAIREAHAVTAHNGMNFDTLALARHGYISFDEYETIGARTFDTLIVEKYLNPVGARGMQPSGYYRLGDTAVRYGIDGKDTVDFAGKMAALRRIKGDKYADKLKPGKTDKFSMLDVLKDAYGGFDMIPVDDPDYVRYLEKDVLAQEGVFLAQMARLKTMPTAMVYVRREHHTVAAMGRSVTLEGSRVDVDLNMRRWSEGQARLDAGRQLLHEKYGMPAEGKKPHVTNRGKAAFRCALLDVGIGEAALERNWPTGKDGSLLMGKEVLNEFLPLFDKANPAAAELCRTILAMNGERSMPQTIMDHTVAGKVHPYIGPDQASGRWSMRNPGLTVVKKSGDERAVILPDTDDEWLLAVDADQADGRIAAALSGDKEYAKLFQPGVDLHSEVAWRAFQNPACREEMDRNNGRCECPLRKSAKVAGFSWNYGGGIGTIMRLGVSEEHARRFDAGMKEAFPQLCAWKDAARELGGALPYGETAPAGDTYRILYSWAGRPMRVERSRAYTQAPALLGQGGTRDLMAEVLLRLDHTMRRRVRAVVHDEFLFSVPAAWTDADSQRLVDSMRFELNGVEFTFGASKLGRNWADCYR